MLVNQTPQHLGVLAGVPNEENGAEAGRYLFAHLFVLPDWSGSERGIDRRAYARSRTTDSEMALGEIAGRVRIPSASRRVTQLVRIRFDINFVEKIRHRDAR